MPRQWTWHYYAASPIDVPLAAQPRSCGKEKASRLAPRQELSATSMDMALLPAAIFLFYGFCHSASSGADLLFAAFCCIFAVQMKIRASVGPFFRVLKAVPLFGRLFFLSPKQEKQSPKPCRASGRPPNRRAKRANLQSIPLNFPKRRFVEMSVRAIGMNPRVMADV